MEKLSFRLTDFEGPLDLLLYLISKHKLNILDISVSELLDQYLSFIEKAGKEDLEVKSEFLEMASRLLHIKTVSLLPRHEEEAEELKSALTGELMELSLCKRAASILDLLARENVTFVRNEMETDGTYPYSLIHDKELLRKALKLGKGRLMRKLPPDEKSFIPIVKRRIVSVESRIVYLLNRFYKKDLLSFDELFSQSEDKSETVATFLAVLELIKTKRIEADENSAYFHFVNKEVVS